MKKLILMLVLTAFTLSAQEPIDTDGNGYRNISTLEQLRWVSENDSSWSWNFELDNDIDASDTKNWNIGDHDENPETPDSAMGWLPIGGTENYEGFDGIFDGKNHSIDSLYINRPNENAIALFSYTYRNSVLKNINIANCNIVGMKYVGSLIGYNKGKIENCSAECNIEGEEAVGGLIGYNYYGYMNNCSSIGSVVGKDFTGGLVGKNFYTDISSSYSNCSVLSNDYGGGIAGHNTDGCISDCYHKGDVKGNNNIGNLIGLNSGSISTSYSIGTTQGENYVGGLVGCNKNINKKIYNCFSKGEIKGQQIVGGLTGYNSSIILKSYSNCLVNGDSLVGGLVAVNEGYVFDSFWNIEKSGQSISDGGIGKSDDDLKLLSTFTDVDWNFTFVWKIVDSYPIIDLDNMYKPKDNNNNGYIEISNLEHLRWLSETGLDLHKNIELVDSIDALETINWNNQKGFSPIEDYKGNFDGHNYKIKNLYINRPEQYKVGLFRFVDQISLIQNLHIENCNITGSNDVGAIAGENWGVINFCSSTGYVVGNELIGGLLGKNNTGEVYNSFSNCHVEGSNNIGGFVGSNDYISTIESCYSEGNVIGESQVGGFLGENAYMCKIENCYSKSNVDGYREIGGFVGFNYDNAEIHFCYSVGSVTGTNSVGGFAGNNMNIISNSFWDIESSGQYSSAGGTGKSTADMKTDPTFMEADWNFENIWKMSHNILIGKPEVNEGYPYLRMNDSIPSSVEEFIEKNENSIIIYPNPASEYIEISIDWNNYHGRDHLNIDIYDVLGEFVSNVSTSVPSGHLRQRRTIRVDVSTLTKGVYFVKIGNIVEKFVKM